MSVVILCRGFDQGNGIELVPFRDCVFQLLPAERKRGFCISLVDRIFEFFGRHGRIIKREFFRERQKIAARIVRLARVVVFENRKNYTCELIAEFLFLQNLMKELCNLFRRIFECAASPCAQNNGIVVVFPRNPEHGADFIERAVDAFLCHPAVFIQARMIDSRDSHKRKQERCFHQTVSKRKTFAEDNRIRSVNPAEIAIHRIRFRSARHTEIMRERGKLEERPEERASADERFLLRSGAVLNTSAGSSAVCHIEHNRIQPVVQEQFCRINAVRLDNMNLRFHFIAPPGDGRLLMRIEYGIAFHLKRGGESDALSRGRNVPPAVDDFDGIFKDSCQEVVHSCKIFFLLSVFICV